MLSMKLAVVLTILTRGVFSLPPRDSPFHQHASRQTNSIQFSPCYSSTKLECGRYEPPLSYTDSSSGSASLAVIRYKASQSPSLGTIFTNPGGPGVSGVEFLVQAGELLSNNTGGYYDIVSWDPRGVGYSFPKINCFASSAEELTFWARSIPWVGIEARGNFSFGPDIDGFYGNVDDTDTKLRQLGERCALLSGANLTYVGTAATVRDMIGMADILSPNQPINYWGFSYGSMIGSYFINMFPTRVGRVVLDGIVDPTAYSVNPPHKSMSVDIQSADGVFQAFTEQCAGAGTKCAINDGSNQSPAVRGYVLTLIDAVYDAHKLGFPYGSQVMREFVFSYMYSPTNWEELANQLRLIALDLQRFASALGGSGGGALSVSLSPLPTYRQTDDPKGGFTSNTEDLVLEKVQLWRTGGVDNYYRKHPNAARWKNQALADLALPKDNLKSRLTKRQQDGQPLDYSILAITCGDAIDAGTVTTRDVFDEILRVSHEVSQVFGASWSSAGYPCHRWPARSVERYSGPFNNKLANPILVIGNQLDPITPFASARGVTDALGDSAFLIGQDDWGHTSGSMHSDCTISTVAGYFIGGQIPDSDRFCSTNQVIFAGNESREVDLVTTISPLAEGTATAAAIPTGTESVIDGTTLNGSPALSNHSNLLLIFVVLSCMYFVS